MIVNPTYTKRLKYLASCNDDVLPESTSSDQQIDYVEISDVFLSDGIKKSTAYKFGDAPSRARRIIKKDDVLISTVRTYLRAIASVKAKDHGKIASTGFAVLRPNGICPKYFSFSCLSEHFIGEIISKSVGVSYPAINASEIMNIALYVPTLGIQRQIAAYLNRETAKIDKLIAKQQKLIKLLNEKRQALISQAVTKGQDPNVKMKDSGVEWLGEVPEHWKVGLSKRFLGTLSGFAFPSAGFSEDEADPKLLRGINVGVSQLRWNDVVYWKRSLGDKLDDFELEAGDIVLGMDRPIIDKGLRIASVTNADLPCLLLQRVLKFNFGKELLSGYFKLLMEGGFFAAFIEPDMTGVSVPHISPTQVENFKIPVPPIQEQLSILEFITRKVAMFSNLIDKSENSIKLLYEYRQALITSAVTGKIDVRGLVTDEEVAALDADPVLETTDEDFESEVAEADYITEEE